MLLELLLLGGFAHAIRTSDQKKAKKNHKKLPPSLYEDMKKLVKNVDFFRDTVENDKNQDEKEANRDLAISTASFGIATAGALFYPPLSLLSVPGLIYVSVPIFNKSYQSLRKNQKVDVHTLSAITAIVCLLSGSFHKMTIFIRPCNTNFNYLICINIICYF
jgi:cation transport ATPase